MNSVPTPPAQVGGAPRRRTIQRFFAWMLIVIGALFLLLVLVPTEPDPSNPDGAKIVLVFALVMVATGGGWLWATRRRDSQLRGGYEEKAVLAVAARNGGRATVAQIALETQLSMEEAEEAINRLCRRNIAQPDLLDDGTVVYTFGMLPRS
jgi:hypothetical protein